MNKKVLITGATGSIGKVIVNCFNEKGYDVYAVGRNLQKIQDLKKLMPNVHWINVDFLKEFQKIKQNFPVKIDILINCAGIYDYCATENAEDNTIQEILKLNLEVPIQFSKLVIPYMKSRKYGRIINIGSISGSVGEANAAVYSASKAGLIGLTKSLALELAFDNITVNCINPGWVDSEMSDNSLSEEEKQETIEMIPQRRFIEPKEIADLCLYLANEKAKGITGQSINLCAGLSLG